MESNYKFSGIVPFCYDGQKVWYAIHVLLRFVDSARECSYVFVCVTLEATSSMVATQHTS